MVGNNVDHICQRNADLYTFSRCWWTTNKPFSFIPSKFYSFFLCLNYGISYASSLASYFVGYHLMWRLFNTALHFHFTILAFSLLFSFHSVSFALKRPFQCNRYTLNIILSHLFRQFLRLTNAHSAYPYAIHGGSRVIESQKKNDSTVNGHLKWLYFCVTETNSKGTLSTGEK